MRHPIAECLDTYWSFAAQACAAIEAGQPDLVIGLAHGAGAWVLPVLSETIGEAGRKALLRRAQDWQHSRGLKLHRARNR